MNYNKIKKYYLDVVDEIHKGSVFTSSLDFFRKGFKLTADDRFSEFKMEFSPWIEILCEWFDSPEVEWIYLIQGSQTAKTTFMMGIFLYVSKETKGPCPCTWIMNIEEESNLFVSERLKVFLDEAGMESAKRWKRQAFRVFNAALKVGYASTKNSMRSKPARFIFGDECSLWRETISYLKKRTRTYIKKRKGVFGTTPPESEKHHSWQECITGNVYCIFVKCPDCGERQRLELNNIRWYKKPDGELWDLERVKSSARYQCSKCKSLWKETQKKSILKTGIPVCVDPHTWEPTEEKSSTSKTLQLSALYSLFTTWGQLASDFLDAKAAGWESLKVFITDELAEIPKQKGKKLEKKKLEIYKAPGRVAGFLDGYDCYTGGIDLQRTGLAYYVILGYQKGVLLSGHILLYGKVLWKNAFGVVDWGPLLKDFSPFVHRLYKCPIDATDGEEQQTVLDFCNWAGPPFIPLLDQGSEQIVKTKNRQIALEATGGGQQKFSKVLSINSSMFKNDLATAFQRVPGETGAWTFPANTTDEFFMHLGNEKKTTKQRGGAKVIAWEPAYSGAQQHYFSALVYGFAGVDEVRHLLQEKVIDSKKVSQPKRTYRRVAL